LEKKERNETELKKNGGRKENIFFQVGKKVLPIVTEERRSNRTYKVKGGWRGEVEDTEPLSGGRMRRFRVWGGKKAQLGPKLRWKKALVSEGKKCKGGGG